MKRPVVIEAADLPPAPPPLPSASSSSFPFLLLRGEKGRRGGEEKEGREEEGEIGRAHV